MVKRILIIFGFWVLGLFTLMIISTPNAKTATIVETTSVSKSQIVEATQRITHRDTVWLPANMMCPQWAQMAIDVGWLETDLPKIDSKFYLWYAIRNATDYRENIANSYRIKCAESSDLIHWIRTKELGLDIDPKSNWENTMVEYPHVFEFENQIYMLYNGNGFGETGFGYAILKR